LPNAGGGQGRPAQRKKGNLTTRGWQTNRPGLENEHRDGVRCRVNAITAAIAAIESG
jgi:hypothetical protein